MKRKKLFLAIIMFLMAGFALASSTVLFGSSQGSDDNAMTLDPSLGVTIKEVECDSTSKIVQILIIVYPPIVKNRYGFRCYDKLITPEITLQFGNKMDLRIRTIYKSRFSFSPENNDLPLLRPVLSHNMNSWREEPTKEHDDFSYYQWWVADSVGEGVLQIRGMIDSDDDIHANRYITGYWPMELDIPIKVIR